jgi:DNA-binding GntR family transcriptional regulator
MATAKEITLELRKRIDDGTYSVGDRLPSVAKLAAEFHAAPLTVRSAQEQLRLEGVLHIAQGMGTLVLTKPTIAPNSYQSAAELARAIARDLGALATALEKLEGGETA